MKRKGRIRTKFVLCHQNRNIKEVVFMKMSKVLTGLFVVLFAVASLAMLPAQAQAVDTDNDGFTDQEETDGLLIATGAVIDFPGLSSALPRDQRLDPASPDLFVILVPADTSELPANPVEYVSQSQADGGLGIVIHMIDPAQIGDDRMVISRGDGTFQKAVRVTENVSGSTGPLGAVNYGTPNGLDNAIVYTQRIINHIESVCDGASQCKDSTGKVGQALIDHYIMHTISHEIGHMMQLAPEYNRRFGGYHFKTGSKVVMEQSAKYTNKGGRVTFYISEDYSEPSQAAATLSD